MTLICPEISLFATILAHFKGEMHYFQGISGYFQENQAISSEFNYFGWKLIILLFQPFILIIQLHFYYFATQFDKTELNLQGLRGTTMHND